MLVRAIFLLKVNLWYWSKYSKTTCFRQGVQNTKGELSTNSAIWFSKAILAESILATKNPGARWAPIGHSDLVSLMGWFRIPLPQTATTPPLPSWLAGTCGMLGPASRASDWLAATCGMLWAQHPTALIGRAGGRIPLLPLSSRSGGWPVSSNYQISLLLSDYSVKQSTHSLAELGKASKKW